MKIYEHRTYKNFKNITVVYKLSTRHIKFCIDRWLRLYDTYLDTKLVDKKLTLYNKVYQQRISKSLQSIPST